MAKKRATRKTPATEQAADDGKVAFQVRFDSELHAQLKGLAEQADLSLNQLIQGMCRGLVEHGRVGRAVVQKESGFVSVRPESRCVYFGTPGIPSNVPEAAYPDYVHRHDEEPEPVKKGWVWFGLDFSERGVVSYGQ